MRTPRLVLVAAFAAAACSTGGELRQSPAPDTTEQARVIRLEYAAADAVASTVNRLIESKPGARVAADAATNSVLVRGSQAQIEQMMDLIAVLDVDR